MKKTMLAVVPLIIVSMTWFQAEAVQKGDFAPNFSLKDLSGETVELKDFDDTAVLLVFGATWCPHCRKEVPELKRAESIYRDRGLRVVYIDVQESRKKVSAFVRKYGIQYTVLLDRTGTVARKYGVVGIPYNVLIGSDKRIKSAGHSVPKNLENMIK